MNKLIPFLLTLVASSAAAQVQPRVVVIFDTSGSMLWDYESVASCTGDGSVDFPDRCQPGLRSKMSVAKGALASIVRGRPTVSFGLMRYGQLEPGDPGFGQLQTQVGAQYTNAAGAIVGTNYDGSTNGCGPADMLVDPGAASAAEILTWLDGRENYPNNKELRANGYTPLTHSMATARDEVSRLIAADPDASCSPYYVLLLTDGYQQCPGADAGDPAVRAQVTRELLQRTQALRDLRVGGENFDVRTFVVGFGEGTEFATELDEMARVGGTAVDANNRIDLRNGSAYQANDPAGLIDQLGAAVDNALPRERCDGVDNDCDVNVDEGFPNLSSPCSVGVGECGRDGEIVCADNGLGTDCSAVPGDPRAEVCDREDNDCDGRIDEGVLNRCGECGDALVEVCDGQDNDCDGTVDEGVVNRCGGCGDLPLEVCNGRDDDCDNRVDEGVFNECGRCGDLPVEVCDCQDNDCDNRIDEHSDNCPRCDGCTPATEVCNGLDDDCDNEIDNGVLNACGQCGDVPTEICNGLDDDCDGSIDESFPEDGTPCGDNAGACQAGDWLCRDGDLVCDGATQPSTEVCDDGIDNDCDTLVDESGFNACGYCGAGRLETCDNIDNNCDGSADDGTLCRGDAECINGECAQLCESGECFGDYVCVRNYCVTPCRNTDCLDGWVCDDGECRDPCVGINCPDSTYCTLGRCEPNDCYGPGGCPDGEYCQNGACIQDPCANVECGPGEGCVDGQCFEHCSAVNCPDGRCVNGQCEPRDNCSRVSCPYPQVCDDGACVDDPCFEVDCPTGHICLDGACVDDPCLGISCPEGSMCHRGECSGGNGLGNGNGGEGRGDIGVGGVDSGVTGTTSGTGAGDGCDCDATGRSPAAPLWLLFAGLAMARRRRDRE